MPAITTEDTESGPSPSVQERASLPCPKHGSWICTIKQTSRAQALSDNLVLLRELLHTEAIAHPVDLPLTLSSPLFDDELFPDSFSDPWILALRRCGGLASPMLTERRTIPQVAKGY